jgi:hypothetical protein
MQQYLQLPLLIVCLMQLRRAVAGSTATSLKLHFVTGVYLGAALIGKRRVLCIRCSVID